MKAPDRYTCEQMLHRIDRYLDQTLSEGELLLVEEHLGDCEVCVSKYRFEQSLLEGIRGKLRRTEMSSDLMSQISACLTTAADDNERP